MEDVTLPEIPDEAIEAACFAEAEQKYGHEGFSRRQAMVPVAVVHAGLHAAWPLLYAAALRHAADRGEGVDGGPAYHASPTLRQWADEVGSEPAVAYCPVAAEQAWERMRRG